MRTLRNIGLAVAATVAIAGAAIGTSAPAMAQYRHHHWHGGGWGPGFGAGLAFGAAPYYYRGGPYAYGDCYIRRQVVINRFGERIVRRVRVCD